MNGRAQSRSSGLFFGSVAAMVALVLLTQLPGASTPRGYLKGAVAPLAVVSSGVLDWAGGGVAVLRDAGRLRADDRRLSAENAALRRQVAELQAQGAENSELRKALEFQKTIARGRADGLQVGMVVVGGAGLVGRVSEVGERSATVKTLVDAESRVNAYTSKSGLEGTVIGEGGPLGMEVLPKPGVVVAPGEWALTSGIGGLFPRGILVGQVAQFHRRDSATLEQADLAPAVDFSAISMVMVLTDFRPAAP
ncbi:MAG: rod shape-determining protein MreC [Chloroflexi bacterium]|nr:MAG: rod shape-determining protein MreC [Chloroflexota bacterium]